MKRIWNENKNVFEASYERIEFIWKNFERVYLSFSGGKDSGIMLNLTIKYMKENPGVINGRKLGIQIMDNEANYDESKIPAYTLPDVLEGVKTASDWPVKRAMWHSLIAREMFGETTAAMQAAKAISTPAAPDKAILNGKGILKQITVKLAGEELNVALFLPKSAQEKPVPVFLG